MSGLEAEFAWSPSSVPGLKIDAQFSLLETEVAGGTNHLILMILLQGVLVIHRLGIERYCQWFNLWIYQSSTSSWFSYRRS